MFLLIPALLTRGGGFWPALLIGCLPTVALCAFVTLWASRLGINLQASWSRAAISAVRPCIPVRGQNCPADRYYKRGRCELGP